jgi:glycosyltransferase involved in cell wall biosynthesis
VHNFAAPPIGYRNVVGHFWILKRAADIARRLQPDVIHAPEYVSTAVFATLGIQSPLVMTVPGNVYHRIRYGHSYEWYYLQILKWAARVSARRCAGVIAVSQEMKRWWQWTGSLPEQVHWIPYGVDVNRFHPVPFSRTMLGIPRDAVFLLYVGRFATEKGLLDLLSALTIVRNTANLEKVRVMLIGKGPQFGQIQEVITREELDSVVQIQPWVHQDELSMWYSAADALLLPSHTEAFARVVLESLSCGTAVIGSKITGTEDHIHDGINGFLFPAGDSQSLANILTRIIVNPSIVRSMRQSNVNYVEKHLTWQRIIERIVSEVYTPLTATRVDATANPVRS